MSRPSASLARSIASCSTRTNSRPASIASRSFARDQSTNSRGSTTSIDPRILSGVPEFITKSNVNTLCDWQAGLWDRLQAEMRNHPGLLEVKQKWDRSGLDMTHLVSYAAREQELTLAFNYASLLLNNSFFLESLHGDTQQAIPSEFKDLGDKVEAYADGIVGSGWLWLVRSGTNHSDVDIIPTFSSGTLLVHNRSQRGREEMAVFGTPETSETKVASLASEIPNTEETPVPTPESSQIPTPPTPSFPTVGYKPSRLPQRQLARDSAPLPAPLAVLNLFEHAYLGEKYGVWDRKQYAKDWWKQLDWNKVQRRASQLASPRSRF